MKWISRFPYALLVIALFAACTPAGERSGHIVVKESQRIFGGDEVQVQSGSSLTVAMITLDDDMGQSFVCTGTFISARLLLTASHCVTTNKSQMRVLFGAAPFAGTAFVDVPIADVHVYHEIVADGSSAETGKRHDLALIEIRGLPDGARTAELPESAQGQDLQLKNDSRAATAVIQSSRQTLLHAQNLGFVALGYGRLDGLDLGASDTGGSGVLRRVDLSAENYSAKATTFTVLQETGERGVCFGDSGGPALLERTTVDGVSAVVMGVASGVLDLEGTDPYAHGYDACKQRSIYMNVLPYLPWIERIQKKVDLLRQSSDTTGTIQ